MPKTTCNPIRLVVPAVWKDLLAIEDFDSLSVRPDKFRESDLAAHATDPTPFCDDHRTFEQTEGDRLYRATLFSGNNNYYYAIEVLEKKSDASDFSKAKAINVPAEEVEMNIPADVKIETIRGETIEVSVEPSK